MGEVHRGRHWQGWRLRRLIETLERIGRTELVASSSSLFVAPCEGSGRGDITSRQQIRETFVKHILDIEMRPSSANMHRRRKMCHKSLFRIYIVICSTTGLGYGMDCSHR
jgi:hypothetical protein